MILKQPLNTNRWLRNIISASLAIKAEQSAHVIEMSSTRVCPHTGVCPHMW